jgi:CheY-like chemotaxis protein
MQVVAADPDLSMRRFFQETLGGLGHTIRTVSSGRQLLYQCELLPPDLVISAVHLHDMNAFRAASDVCQAMQVPFIVVSAHCETELILPPDSADCVFAILSKPVREQELGIAISWATERFQLWPGLLLVTGQ